MGLISKTIIMRWNGSNRKYYENKGYIFTKAKDEFEVKVEDLSDGSNVKVNVQCDECGKILRPMKWQDYKRGIHEDDTYYCNSCVHKLFAGENIIKSKLKNGESFGYWLVKNLPLRDAIEIILRWDEEKNSCDIREVGYGSHRKKYYFKCIKGIHSSELKRISDFTMGNKGSLDCKACNSFAQWGIDNICSDFLEKYWDYEKNNELGIDPWGIPKNSDSKKVWIKCQEKFYHESYLIVCFHFTNGVRCSYCGGKKVHLYDSLGYLHPEAILIWSEKNKKSPYDYLPFSSQKVWWKCTDGKHKDYYRDINNSNRSEFRCPECFKEILKDLMSKENNPNWKGGITPLRDYLRSKINKWKTDSIKESNYKCDITGEKFDIIHHLYSFNQIVQETMEIINLPIYDEVNKYTDEELKLIEEKCLELHYKYGLGACLSNEIHELFHNKYGRGNNTSEQFEEFKLRYDNGDFL